MGCERLSPLKFLNNPRTYDNMLFDNVVIEEKQEKQNTSKCVRAVWSAPLLFAA